jgi:xanthosine utilization system XapX-like protein
MPSGLLQLDLQIVAILGRLRDLGGEWLARSAWSALAGLGGIIGDVALISVTERLTAVAPLAGSWLMADTCPHCRHMLGALPDWPTRLFQSGSSDRALTLLILWRASCVQVQIPLRYLTDRTWACRVSAMPSRGRELAVFIGAVGT